MKISLAYLAEMAPPGIRLSVSFSFLSPLLTDYKLTWRCKPIIISGIEVNRVIFFCLLFFPLLFLLLLFFFWSQVFMWIQWCRFFLPLPTWTNVLVSFFLSFFIFFLLVALLHSVRGRTRVPPLDALIGTSVRKRKRKMIV